MNPPTPNLPLVDHPAPRLLTAWSAPGWHTVCWGLSVLCLLMWGGVTLGEWYMRFHWYQWQKTFVVKTGTGAASQGPALQVTTNAASRGGVLSRLIGIPSIARRYEEPRPMLVSCTDEQGYRNVPPTRDRSYPVVVVGDSFMAAYGVRMDQTFAAQLARISGVPVYNHACAGRGTFWALVRFLTSERFRVQPPKLLLWGIIEQELAGDYFGGGYQQAARAGMAVSAVPGGIRWDGQALRPAALHRSLPMTSAYAQVAAKWWNCLRYHALGQLNPMVVPARGAVLGGPMLFYREAIDAMQWPHDRVNPVQIAESIGSIAKLCRARQVQLAVVLIPSKERIYDFALPPEVQAEQPVRPSVLPELAFALRLRGVPTCDLLTAYRQATQRGERLYWRDDTHWNSRGMELAAEATWRELAPVMR